MPERNFKDRFKYLLDARKLSQKEIAQITNLTESAISHYIKGNREPKGAILLSIANALGTSTDYLKGKTDDVAPSGMNDELEEAFRLIARNAPNMSAEQKARFANALFQQGI